MTRLQRLAGFAKQIIQVHGIEWQARGARKAVRRERLLALLAQLPRWWWG